MVALEILTGFFLQLSNPKAIFFWLAVASVGGVGDAPLPVVVLFVAGAFVNSFAGHGGYALLLSSTPFRSTYQRFRRWIEGGLGCFLPVRQLQTGDDAALSGHKQRLCLCPAGG